MHTPVSALIVNFRAYPETDGCLHSLHATAPAVEIIVVDHATLFEPFERLRRAHPRVKFLATADNRGFGAGVNAAARLATGRYLLVLNADTVLADDAVARLASWLDDHPTTGIVAPLVRTADGRIEASARAHPGWTTVLGGRSTWLTQRWPANPLSRLNLLTGSHVQAPTSVDWVSGACMLVRREAFDAAGGFDERLFLYWEDADLCRRLGDTGWNIIYHPGASVTHFGGRSARHRSLRASVAFHRSVFRYFLTHGGRWRYAASPAVYVALRLRLAVAIAQAALERGRLRARQMRKMWAPLSPFKALRVSTTSGASDASRS